ncbi:DUF6194 family protein [Longispora sp. NPDC051575]|uniref:DUF6194 family protein n=1 Tax=Longispora sp. NPDC051575 TaxID=3154943 RepID=UPI00343CBBD1
MEIQDIIESVGAMDGVLVLTPRPGDGSPEIAWGDTFFYYAPDGVVPKAQPFATIVTKDYPGDDTSRLDRPDAFRLNIAAGAEEFGRWTRSGPTDPGTADVIGPHPVYGSLHWLAVVNPGPETATAVDELLREAHRLARERFQRHANRGRADARDGQTG